MLNKVMLIGHLGAAPEMRQTEKGVSCTQFSLATERTWTGDDDEEKKEVEWHTIITWRGLAEACHKHLKKGSRVYVEGRLHYREWEDPEKGKQRKTEVIAEGVRFL